MAGGLMNPVKFVFLVPFEDIHLNKLSGIVFFKYKPCSIIGIEELIFQFRISKGEVALEIETWSF